MRTGNADPRSASLLSPQRYRTSDRRQQSLRRVRTCPARFHPHGERGQALCRRIACEFGNQPQRIPLRQDGRSPCICRHSSGKISEVCVLVRFCYCYLASFNGSGQTLGALVIEAHRMLPRSASPYSRTSCSGQQVQSVSRKPPVDRKTCRLAMEAARNIGRTARPSRDPIVVRQREESAVPSMECPAAPLR